MEAINGIKRICRIIYIFLWMAQDFIRFSIIVSLKGFWGGLIYLVTKDKGCKFQFLITGMMIRSKFRLMRTLLGY